MIAKDLVPTPGIKPFAIMKTLAVTPVSAIFKGPGAAGREDVSH
jgi:hypothetical protein